MLCIYTRAAANILAKEIRNNRCYYYLLYARIVTICITMHMNQNDHKSKYVINEIKRFILFHTNWLCFSVLTENQYIMDTAIINCNSCQYKINKYIINSKKNKKQILFSIQQLLYNLYLQCLPI